VAKQKGCYFSVRFSAALLERIEAVRIGVYGERTPRAETIRRLIEDSLQAVSRCIGHTESAATKTALSHLSSNDFLDASGMRLRPVRPVDGENPTPPCTDARIERLICALTQAASLLENFLALNEGGMGSHPIEGTVPPDKDIRQRFSHNASIG
jgi:hypothetical protein